MRKPNEDQDSSSLTPLLERETRIARSNTTSIEDDRLVTANKQQGSLQSPAYNGFRLSIETTSTTSTHVEDHHGETLRQSLNIKPTAAPETPSQEPRSTWITFKQNTLTTNGGSILVVIAMFFGALMSLTTQLLETNHKNGQTMHPFQVSREFRSVFMAFQVLMRTWNRSYLLVWALLLFSVRHICCTIT